jgi:hypothetical protein
MPGPLNRAPTASTTPASYRTITSLPPRSASRAGRLATAAAVIHSEIAVCESRLGLIGETASRAVLVKRVLRRLERAACWTECPPPVPAPFPPALPLRWDVPRVLSS